jgi:hypothetical protein
MPNTRDLAETNETRMEWTPPTITEGRALETAQAGAGPSDDGIGSDVS